MIFLQSDSSIRESLNPQLIPSEPGLISRLSFTHLAEIIPLPDENQRRFYEIECIRGNWSVRELRRQIASLYYQRSGLSKDKAKLSAKAHTGAETLQPSQIIRDPYIFEFLGLCSQETMGESDLEDALLDRLQDFLLEMGHGFCLEARQKRILIGSEHFHSELRSRVSGNVGQRSRSRTGGRVMNPFEKKMPRLAESAKLEAAMRANLKSLNFNP